MAVPTRTPRRSKNRAARAPASAGVSSSDRVVEAIHDDIRAGRCVPGQKLIESKLSRDLAISRGPVREGLKRLAAEGVVTLTRHRGAFVRALTREEADETLVVLEVLCGLIARIAAESVQRSANAEKLREALERLAAYRHGHSIADELVRRRHFYDALAQIGGNLQLARMMPLMQIHLFRLQIQPYLDAAARRAQLRGYAETTRAVLAGNPAAAERAMRRHIRRTRERYRHLPDAAFWTAETAKRG